MPIQRRSLYSGGDIAIFIVWPISERRNQQYCYAEKLTICKIVETLRKMAAICSIYTVYIQYVYSIYAAYIQHIYCILYKVYIQYIYIVYIQYIYGYIESIRL